MKLYALVCKIAEREIIKAVRPEDKDGLIVVANAMNEKARSEGLDETWYVKVYAEEKEDEDV